VPNLVLLLQSAQFVSLAAPLYGEPIGSHKSSFEVEPPPTPTASTSPRLRVRNPTSKLQSLLSQEQLKLRTAHLAIFTGSIRTQVH